LVFFVSGLRRLVLLDILISWFFVWFLLPFVSGLRLVLLATFILISRLLGYGRDSSDLDGRSEILFFAALLIADTPSLGLVRQQLLSGLLGLGLVDVLYEDALVLEDVTLGLGV